MMDVETNQPGTARLRRRRLLVPLIGLVAVAALAVGAVAWSAKSESTTPASKEILGISLTTADGRTSSLAEFRGEPLVVNFFASWCPPCRAEMPDLERAHQQLKDRVRFLGVNVDFDVSTWKSFVAGSGITYETVFEPTQDLLRAVGGKGMPTTVLIAVDGTIEYVHTGALDTETLLGLVDRELS